jgi:hypothetical protein
VGCGRKATAVFESSPPAPPATPSWGQELRIKVPAPPPAPTQTTEMLDTPVGTVKVYVPGVSYSTSPPAWHAWFACQLLKLHQQGRGSFIAYCVTYFERTRFPGPPASRVARAC